MPCIFCQIASGELKAVVVYQDELLIAFLDTRPLFKGHVLLIPKQHFETYADLPTELIQTFFLAGQLLTVAVKEAMQSEGIFNAMNNTVSQSVPHLHLHIVPRTKGDGLKGFFWPRTSYASEEEMQDVATLIRSKL